MNAALRYGAVVLLATAAAAAPLASRAGVGLMQLPGVASDGAARPRHERPGQVAGPALPQRPVLAACRPHCELIAHLPSRGHAALLSPPPPPSVLGRVAADLLADPPGFDRAELPAVDQKIVAFFRARLLP
ncbi:MAG: alpha/beta hydrolase family protein [Ramlibacter sp.]|nr:alpha/beta hydrolase family protein [Ramlibacter sp.]